MIDANITSPEDNLYNCIAWAIHDNQNWWEPDPMNQYYWPEDVPRQYTIDAYTKAYESRGYETCDDFRVEPNYEKVALYKNESNTPTHASRQIDSNKWTSKLGASFDVEHPFFDVWVDLLLKPHNIVAQVASVFGYGKIAAIFRKRIK